MSTSTKGLSASYMGVRYGITEKTARLFMMKVREAMSSSENFPMDGNVHVDKFVLEGREKNKVGRSYDSKKKKAITTVQLTKEGKVVTDKWRGYRPITKAYDITQIESDNKMITKALHTMIHQVKSWIRTTYSWVSDFNEFCYRINRSQSKDTIFDNLINKMVKADMIYQTKLIRK